MISLLALLALVGSPSWAEEAGDPKDHRHAGGKEHPSGETHSEAAHEPSLDPFEHVMDSSFFHFLSGRHLNVTILQLGEPIRPGNSV